MKVAESQAQRSRGTSIPVRDESEESAAFVRRKHMTKAKGNTAARQTPEACYRCDNKGHLAEACWHKDKECHKCKKMGRIASACKSSAKMSSKPRKLPSKAHHVEQSSEAAEKFQLFTLSSQAAPRVLITVSVNHTPLSMEVDTGAAVSLISRLTWEEKWNKPLESPSIILTTYSEDRLKILSKATVSVKYNGQGAELTLIVVDGDGPSLLGRNWLQVIRLD